MAKELNGPKNKEKALKDTPAPPLPFERHIKQPTEKKKHEPRRAETIKASSTDEALEKILEIKKNAEDLKNKIDEMYQKLGWTVAYIHRYLETPGNFTPEQKEFIRKERESLMKHFNIPEEKRKDLRNAYEGGSSTSRTKGRSKKIPPNRRNWISMR